MPWGNSSSSSRVSCWVYHVAFIALGISSFLLSNAMWAEMSALYRALPEHERLASYLLVALQTANIVPAIVMADFPGLRCLRLESAIWLLLVSGFITCQLLSFFWDYTLPSVVFKGHHSVVLFLLVFLSGCVNNSSSLALYPYVAKFPRRYVSSLAVGEGASGILVSLIAAVQNVGGDKQNFSVRVYFQCVSSIYFIAFFSYYFLLCHEQHVDCPIRDNDSSAGISVGEAEPEEDGGYKRMHGASDSVADFSSSSPPPRSPLSFSSTTKLKLIWPYLIVQFFISAAAYGIVPAILPIATTGYVDETHILQYSSFVSMTMDPLSRAFTHYYRIYRLTLLFGLVGSFATLLITAAAMSPQPPFNVYRWGGLFIIVVNALFTASFAFCSTMVYYSIHKALSVVVEEEEEGRRLRMPGDQEDTVEEADGISSSSITRSAAALVSSSRNGTGSRLASMELYVDDEDKDVQERQLSVWQEGFKWSAFVIQAGAFVGSFVTFFVTVSLRKE